MTPEQRIIAELQRHTVRLKLNSQIPKSAHAALDDALIEATQKLTWVERAKKEGMEGVVIC